MSFIRNIGNVSRRELHRIYKHPRYVVMATVSIIFAYVFFLTLMRDGQPQRLPIAIVDADGTYLSQRLCHEIDAMQGVSVAYVYNNHKEAREAMQRQQIYAFVEIPAGTYEAVLRFESPHIVLYANTAYLLSGTLSYKSLMTICNLASGAVQREVLRKKGMTDEAIMGLIQPIVLDAHYIGNPMANYQSYLLTTILPGILGLLVMLLTVYVIGIEMRQRSAGEWLATAEGNMQEAIIGKLLPYALWFVMLQLLGEVILFGPLHFTHNGNFLVLVLASILYVLAMMGAGVFFMGLMEDLRNAVCLSAFYGILGFSLSGFTYPVSGMSPALQALSVIFPLRQNYLIYVNTALFGLPLADSYWNMCVLIAFMLLPLTTNYRIKKRILNDETTE